MTKKIIQKSVTEMRHCWMGYDCIRWELGEWLTVRRRSGFTSIMPRRRVWQSGGTKCGMWKTPRLTFSSSWRKLSSSKGNAPTSRAYRITPQDQTSALRPSYFSPWKDKTKKSKIETFFWFDFQIHISLVFAFCLIISKFDWPFVLGPKSLGPFTLFLIKLHINSIWPSHKPKAECLLI